MIVGLLETVGDLVTSFLSSIVKQRYPDIELRLTIGYPPRVLDWLSGGHADLGIFDDLGESGATFEHVTPAEE